MPPPHHVLADMTTTLNKARYLVTEFLGPEGVEQKGNQLF